MARGGPVQGLGVTAAQDRWTMENSGPGIGVIGPDDFMVGSGIGMSSTISTGRCRIRGTNSAGGDSGVYELLNDTPISRSHATANGTNPRVDQIVARVVDFQEQRTAISEDVIVLTGLATSGASLDNRSGAALLPANALLLADVLVPVGASGSASFVYRDRRRFASWKAVPHVRTPIVQVPFIGLYTSTAQFSVSATSAAMGWILRYLPRRITATKIRWAYRQAATAFSGANYNIGIYDSSGRKVAETGVVAGTGAANTIQARAETIPTTTFEPGMYYVAFGTSGGGLGQMSYMGDPVSGVSGGPVTIWPTPAPNIMGGISAGGTTMPTTLLGTVDNYTTATSGLGGPLVPAITLSTT